MHSCLPTTSFIVSCHILMISVCDLYVGNTTGRGRIDSSLASMNPNRYANRAESQNKTQQFSILMWVSLASYSKSSNYMVAFCSI